MSIVNGGYAKQTTRLAIADIRVTHDCQIDGYRMTKDASRAVGALVVSRNDVFRFVKIDKRFERVASIRTFDRDHPEFKILCEQYGAI